MPTLGEVWELAMILSFISQYLKNKIFLIIKFNLILPFLDYRLGSYISDESASDIFYHESNIVAHDVTPLSLNLQKIPHWQGRNKIKGHKLQKISFGGKEGARFSIESFDQKMFFITYWTIDTNLCLQSLEFFPKGKMVIFYPFYFDTLPGQ